MDFLENPVSVGVLNGLLGSIATGQEVRRTQKQKAAEAEADWNVFLKKEDYKNDNMVKQKGYELFTNAATTDQATALAVVSNPSFAPQLRMLPTAYANSIFAKAMGDVQFTPQENELLKTAQSSKEAAAAIYTNTDLEKLYGGTPFWSMIGAYTATQFSSQEMQILQQINGDYDRAQLYLPIYGEDTPLGKYIRKISAPTVGYTPLSSETLTTIRDTMPQVGKEEGQEGEYASAMEVINAEIERIRPYANPDSDAFSQRAAQDIFTLNLMKKAYASPEASDDPTKLLEQALNFIKGLGNSEERKAAAASSVEVFKNAFNITTLDTQDSVIFGQIAAIADVTEKVEKGTLQFVGQNKSPVLEVPLGGPLNEKNAMSFLDMLEANPNIVTIRDSMDSDSRTTFDEKVQQAFRLVYNAATKTTESVGVDGKRVITPGVAPDFSLTHDRLYNDLPFVSKFLHGPQMNIPEYGSTREPNGNLPFDQVADDSRTPLPPTQIRVSPSKVIDAPNAAAFAQSKGTTAAQLLNSNDVAFDMLDMDSSNPDGMFEAAMIISGSGIFNRRYTSGLSEQVYKDISYTLIRTGYTTPLEQALIIAANMPDNIPSNLIPRGGQSGVPVAAYMDFISESLGKPVNLDDITKATENQTSFLLSINDALQASSGMTGSRAVNAIVSTYLNFVGLEDSFFQSIGEKAGALMEEKVSSFIKLEDMDFSDTTSQQSNRTGVLNTAKEYLKSDFAKKNAKLASMYVTLAYNYAKTMDPSGRISERDFAAALEAVAGPATGTIEVTRSLLQSFAKRAEDNIAYNDMVYGSIKNIISGGTYTQPTKGDIQMLRAMKHLPAVQRNILDQDRVRQFRSHVAEYGGMKSPTMRKLYLITAAQGFPRGATTRKGPLGREVYEVRKQVLGSEDGSPMISGKPLYVFGDGTMLSREQLQTLQSYSS